MSRPEPPEAPRGGPAAGGATGNPGPSSSPRRDPSPARPIACPHCDSTEVEVEASFGGSLMTRQYWCRGCRTVFEWVRWEPDADPGGWLRG